VEELTRNSESGAANSKNYLRDYRNIFVAHNGAKFDYRFIITKLTQFSNIDIVGCKNQMRSFTFKNLHFNDSFQLLPVGLGKLCKTFKTRNQKFPYDIEGVTLTNWESKRVAIEKYCRMDCLALHEVYMLYISRRAQQYFNNTSFPRKLFPITQSQAALDVLRSCFLDETLNSYPQLQDIETESYLGGSVQAFDVDMHEGVTWDINSSYPGAMHNKMPVEPIPDEETGVFVHEFE